MKKIIFLLVFTAVLIGSDRASAFVTPTNSSATANACAKIFHPIKLTWKQAMEFGSFVAGSSNGYATINATTMGALTVTNDNPYPITPTMYGGAYRFEQPAVIERPATFKAEGQPFWTFGIYLPTDPVHAAVILAPGVNPNGVIDDDPILELDQFNTNQPGSYVPVPGDVDGSGSPDGPGGVPDPNGGIGTFSAIGVRYFAVGARVKIEPNDQPAEYTGEFTVTIYYN